MTRGFKHVQELFFTAPNRDSISRLNRMFPVMWLRTLFLFILPTYDISYKSLRQGFEVCGMMEDVYLARKRNVNGGCLFLCVIVR